MTYRCCGRCSLPPRFWAKVNQSTGPDGCWTWTACSAGRDDDHRYGRFRIGGRTIDAHKLSYEEHHGPVAAGYRVDHRCHQPLCVNPRHLRAITNKQNVEHRAAPNRNGTSGFRGVSFSRFTGRWQASVKHNRHRVFLGRFADISDAAETARIARELLFTHSDSEPTPIAMEDEHRALLRANVLARIQVVA